VTELSSPVIGSLSPSRAADFKSCPLLYRFRSIDRLPQRPSPAATRGTLVHSVLERLFDQPADARTLATAHGLLLPEWDRLREVEPELDLLFDDPAELAGWLASARDLVETYFALENPAWVAPTEREQLVEVVLESGLLLRGVIDRLDVAPTGEIRVVDYKTGASPRDAFEGKALFQMKFYALVVWRTRGVVPRQLRLMYLGDRDTLTYSPDEVELVRFERNLLALWEAISRATESRDFRPSPSRLCDWCDHKALCPAWGGTPPPYPPIVDQPG
jgi:putative RecB family exonuclease